LRRTATSVLIGVVMTTIAHAQEADLSVAKTVDQVVVAPGSSLVYTLTVENHGPGLFEFGTVVDQLSPHAIFVSASPECSYDDIEHEVSCSFPVLDPGTTTEFQIEVTADVLPADAEIGVALSAIETAVGQPATALVAPLTDDHDLITADDQLVGPRGIAQETGATLLVADEQDSSTQSGGTPIIDGRIIRVDRSDGSQTVLTEGGELLNPTGIAVAPDGRVFVADSAGPFMPDQFGRIIEVDPVSGDQTVLASGDLLEQPSGIAVLDTGDLVVADGIGKVILVDPSTGAQALVSEYGDLGQPMAVAQLAPGAVVIADVIGGIVRVELVDGTQSVIKPIDGWELREPFDVEVDDAGHCWVADHSWGDGGFILQVDCVAGAVIANYNGNGVWVVPTGLELLDVLVNRATVSSPTPDPDLSNNADWVATEIEEDFVPPVEVRVSETVTVTDGVLVEVITAVIIEVLETITVTDAVQILPAVLIDVSEVITVDDAVVAEPALQINLTEAINVSDEVNVQPLLPVEIQVTETITVADQVTTLPAVVVSLVEAVHVNDAVSVTPLQPVEINVTESIAVTDQIAATPSAMISVSEQITVTDTPQVSVQAIVNIEVQESVTVSDQVGLTIETPVFVDGFETGDTTAWSSTVGGP